jgi:hypothetical protein
MSLGAFAEHHGFYWIPAESDVKDFLDGSTSNSSSNKKILNPWFTTELILPTLDENGKIRENSNVYPSSNSSNSMFDPYSQILADGTYADDVTGQVMDYNFNNGYLEVTVPEAGSLTHPLSSPATFSGANGIALFHLRLGGSGYRINDSSNSLSYDGTRAYLKDCTGVYVGVKAPAGSQVFAYFTTTSMGASRWKNGATYSDTNTEQTVGRTAVFDCGTVPSDDYVELTSGAATGSLAAIDYSGSGFTEGMCVKSVDIAVYGLKAGDKVGLIGVQTLHPGWTPVPYTISGISDITVDDTDAPVEYFNLQGVKVAADNLSSGLYISRKGTKVAKVLVK